MRKVAVFLLTTDKFLINREVIGAQIYLETKICEYLVIVEIA